METFRDFEHDSWDDPTVCSGYRDRLGPVVAQVVEPLLDAARVSAGDRVLDIATGTGVVAAAAAARGADVVGVDFADEQLRRARADHPRIAFERGDADALPFAAAGFDVVVCSFGVPHFPDPDAFFRESARVLRPGGRFAFSVWAAPDRSPVFAAVLGAVAEHGSLDVGLPAGPNFFLHADPATARASLRAAGFPAVTTTVVPQTWDVPAVDDLVGALLDATVRTAALLRRQPPSVLSRVRGVVREAMAGYADGDVLRLPMPAVVVSASKPAT
jgi:SAM-dependent methyltransferase